jgi:ABC-type transport system involved in Fe-S cluster assembly fused permease/ATPase subunit
MRDGVEDVRKTKDMDTAEMMIAVETSTDHCVWVKAVVLCEVLEAAGGDCTLVTIAHGLSIIIYYDTAVVMGAGRVIE